MRRATARGSVLVLGGTAEARELAAALQRAGLPVVSSLAGRTASPHLPAGEVRNGGFGGPQGLADWLLEHECAAVVDATHPFAAQISTSAMSACTAARVPLVRLDRPRWVQHADDRWHWVDDVAAAAELAPRLGRRIFLTIGRQSAGAFAGVSAAWFLIRSVEAPMPPLPPKHELLLDRGPYTIANEQALIQRHAIDLIVTRDSGGAGTEAKLVAARQCGVSVVIVRRPRCPDVPRVPDAAQALEWVHSVVGRE